MASYGTGQLVGVRLAVFVLGGYNWYLGTSACNNLILYSITAYCIIQGGVWLLTNSALFILTAVVMSIMTCMR